MRHYTKIVPLELSLKLKTAGFDAPVTEFWVKDPCIQWEHAFTRDDFNHETVIEIDGVECKPFDYGERLLCSAPSYADVLDWLVEKGVLIDIWRYSKGFVYNVDLKDGERWISDSGKEEQWEEAMKEAIKMALTMMKNEKKKKP